MADRLAATDAVMTHIDAERLARRALELVEIPSPTGESDAVAARYAQMLDDIGLDVAVDSHFPGGANVRGVWRGGAGPTVSLVGHLDTIHAPHAAPRRTATVIHGRGSDDMKGAMAAIVEAIGALKAAGMEPRGTVVVAAHSLHEAPHGHMEGLKRFIAQGALGEGAVVAESFPTQHQILSGKGQSVFAITIRRPGAVVHENYTAPGTINPLDVAVEVAARLRAKHAALVAAGDLPLVGPESLFIGEIHGGDFFNRVPTEARIVGIRRFGAARTWAEIDDEFAAMLDPIRAATGATIDVQLAGNGLGYTVAPDAPIAVALAAAHEAVTGRTLPVAGTKSVTDANVIVRDAGIPAVCYGPDGATAHSDDEFVRVDDLVRAARVYAATLLAYPGLMEGGGN